MRLVMVSEEMKMLLIPANYIPDLYRNSFVIMSFHHNCLFTILTFKLLLAHILDPSNYWYHRHTTLLYPVHI